MGDKCNLSGSFTTMFASACFFSNQSVKHKDLTKSCILKNEAAVSSLNSVT